MPDWCTTKMDYVSHLLYMDGYHKSCYDADSLVERLKAAGFDARLRQYDPVIDKDGHQHLSLYAVGCKRVPQ